MAEEAPTPFAAWRTRCHTASFQLCAANISAPTSGAHEQESKLNSKVEFQGPLPEGSSTIGIPMPTPLGVWSAWCLHRPGQRSAVGEAGRASHASDKSLGLFAPQFPHVKKNWYLRTHFPEFILGLRPANQSLCDVVTQSFVCLFFYMYSSSSSLTLYVKTAFHARPEMFQSWVLWLNCTQDF